MKSAYLKPLLILIPLVALIFGGYLYLQEKKESEGQIAIEEINKIRVLEATSYRDLIKQKDFEIPEQAKVVIVHFWASWCGPCVDEFPQLVELVKMNKGSVQVLAISGDSQKEEIEVFLKSFPEAKTTEGFHIVWDESKDMVKKWGVQKLPESYIYDMNRKLVKRISGAVEWTTEEALAYMKTLTTAAE